jgi:hypothetical protein
MVIESRRMRCVGQVAHLDGKLEETWQSGRPIRKWEDNITMDRTDSWCNDIGWFHLAQDTVKCWGL